MRRDKAVTRILLILSVVRAAVSAPAIIPQRSLEPEVTRGVTLASVKRANLDDESSPAFPQMDNNLPTTSGTVPSHDDTPPAPGDPQLHSDPSPELGTPQLNIDQPPTSGTPQLHDGLPPTPGAPPSQGDPLPAPGTPQLHNGEPSTSGAPPSQGDMSSASEDLQVHDGPSPWQQHSNWRPSGKMLQGESSSGVPQLNDDPWCPVHHPDCQWGRPSPWQQHTNLRPPGEMLQGESSVFPQFDDDPWSGVHRTDWRSPTDVLRVLASFDDFHYGDGDVMPLADGPLPAPGPQVHDDPLPAPGSPHPSHHSDGGSEEFDPSYRWHNDFFVSEWPYYPPSWYDDSEGHLSPHSESEGPLSSHSESEAPMPVDSEAPMPVDSEAAPLPVDSEAPVPVDSEVPMPVDSEAPLSHSETPQSLESDAPPSAPETHTLFNDALNQKLKVFAGVVAVAGVSVGLGLGVNKLIKDHSHKSQPAGRGLASGSVVIRGESMYPLPPKRPVSRANANLRYEDLRLLSILTRRALERLD